MQQATKMDDLAIEGLGFWVLGLTGLGLRLRGWGFRVEGVGVVGLGVRAGSIIRTNPLQKTRAPSAMRGPTLGGRLLVCRTALIVLDWTRALGRHRKKRTRSMPIKADPYCFCTLTMNMHPDVDLRC